MEEQSGAVDSAAGRAPFAAQGTGTHVGLPGAAPSPEIVPGMLHTALCTLSPPG